LSFTPGRDPFDSLYRSLCNPELDQHCSATDAQIALQAGSDILMQVVQTLKPKASQWLFFVDQFEELFRGSQDRKKRKTFIEGLVQVANSGESSVTLVLAMRSDFLNQISPYPEFGKLAGETIRFVTDMYSDELRLAIEQPAAQHGVVFENGLVDKIIEHVEGQAGYLPLLQYTLNLLWETEAETGSIHDRTLNTSTYRNLGGVRGALQKHVDQIYGALSKEEQLAAQRIFLKLVGIGKSTESETDCTTLRRPALRSEFSDGLEPQVLKQLIDANLLVSDRSLQANESTVEVAHEILLTAWKKLNGWIQDNWKAIDLRNRINEDLEHWQKDKKDGNLLSDSRLAQALDLRKNVTFQQVLGGFSEPANQFIDASKERQNRQRRRTITGLTVFSCISLSLAGVAFYQLQQALRQRVEQLVATANAQLSTQPVDALIHSIAAAGLSQSAFVQFPDQPSFLSVDGSLLDSTHLNQEQLRIEAMSLSVAFSPDGKVFVTGGSDIQLWNATTGQPIGQPLQGYKSWVDSVAFSPDGKMIATGGSDRTVRLWDATTRQPIGQPLQGHQYGRIAVAFSPDNKMIASGGWGGLRLWDVVTGQAISQPLQGHRLEVYSVAFSHNGKMIVSGSRDGTIQLWDAITRKPIGQSFRASEKEVNSVAFSPDDEMIVSGGGDGKLQLWDTVTRQRVGQSVQEDVVSDPNGFMTSSSITSVAFSSDGEIVSGSENGTVRLWNLLWESNKAQIFTIKFLRGHLNSIKSVAFSPNNKHIVSSSDDGTVRVWNVTTENLIEQSLEDNPNAVGLQSSVAFSPDSKIIARGDWSTTVQLWDVTTGRLIGKLVGHQGPIKRVAFSPDGKMIFSASEDGTIRLWDVITKKPINYLLQEGISHVVSPDGRIIAIRVNNREIQLWDAITKQPIGHPLLGYESTVDSMALSPDNKHIVGGNRDGTLQLWDLMTGKPIGKPLQNFGSVTSVAFSPDGMRIVSGGVNKELRVWDATTGQPIGQPLQGQKAIVNSVGFSPNGTMIFSGSSDGTVQLWDAVTQQPIGQPLEGPRGAVTSVAFSPDNEMIVAGGYSTRVRVWYVSRKKLLQIACQQMRYHPLLLQPKTEVAKEARNTCQQYIRLDQ
jgi:WD40 repeat protein